MMNLKKFFPAFFALLVPFFAAAETTQFISYELSMPEPHTHYYHVSIVAEKGGSDPIDFKLPVWAPGSYLVRDFSRHVEDFAAVDQEGKTLPFSKNDKNTWRVIVSGSGQVRVSYKVYAFEPSVRTSFLDASHGFVSGSSVFMFIDGRENLPIRLEVKPYPEWGMVSTGLKRSNSCGWHYEAPDYDVFIDAPIEIGNHHVFSFEAAGALHEVAMYGQANYDEKILTRDLAKVVQTATRIFDHSPNERYLFIVHNLDNRGGGLEHLNSTTLQVDRWTYSNPALYKGFLALAAHEYFHLWWVKRARPSRLGPFDYDRENYTSLLWAMEGFTSYYDDLILRRAGFYSQNEYLNKLMGTIGYIENLPGNTVQSAAMSSFDAWIKAYQPNENSGNSSVSYYSKGSALGAMLDLEIIHSTKGRKRLDDALKYLYEKYYLKENRGFTDEEFRQALELTAGKDLEDFFNDHVYGTKRIDYNKYLGYAGLKLTETPVQDLTLGINITDEEGKLKVQSVVRGSSAYQAGINAFDEIIALDGYRVDADLINKILATKNIGDQLTVTLARDGLLQEIIVSLEANPSRRYILGDVANKTAEQAQVFEQWIGTKQRF